MANGKPGDHPITDILVHTRGAVKFRHLLMPLILVGSIQQGCHPPESAVTPQQFRQLTWLVGRWRGSGRFVPAFYEQYRFRDDSTIAMTAFTDSTFRAETADSSTIELRGGRVRTRTATSTYEAIEFSPTSVRFRRVGSTDGGHRFDRVSDNEWNATLYPRGASADTTILNLRRVPSELTR
jgi:hypothetical protein